MSRGAAMSPPVVTSASPQTVVEVVEPPAMGGDNEGMYDCDGKCCAVCPFEGKF